MSYLIFILAFPLALFGQTLTENSRYSDHLQSGEKITLYSTRDCATCFYYLPANFGIARKQDGTPELSLVTWKNDDNSQVIGGILHFLVQWGLTKEQEQSLICRLRTNTDSLAMVMGPASVQSTANTLYFQGKDDLAALLNAHITRPPQAPVMPGSKMAFSFRFGEEEIGKFMAHLKNPAKSVTKLVVPYIYKVSTPDGAVRTIPLQIELSFEQILKMLNNAR